MDHSVLPLVSVVLYVHYPLTVFFAPFLTAFVVSFLASHLSVFLEHRCKIYSNHENELFKHKMNRSMFHHHTVSKIMCKHNFFHDQKYRKIAFRNCC